ncbi:hypothetical protein CDD83_352 [Cordyceps sp. RAO-2017]|nr:hypothetical protein CDD83_352 [Cordyceps sp. RAO-2017]
MPGVPSYRGCEACHRQKKKCDQVRPACSRCARLRIPCVGCGVQRFLFKDETESLRAAGKRSGTVAASPAGGRGPAETRISVPSRPLSNQVTLAAGAIASVVQITDPRYDLFSFGTFIEDIPSQMGANPALDASAHALAAAFGCVHTGRVTPEALGKYVRALRSVQRSIQDPAIAYSEQTLCAIYFIMLCQGWISSEDFPFPGHGRAMAHLLNVIVSKNLHHSLNYAMLISVSISVLLESLVNPTIQLRPWLFKLVRERRPTVPVQSIDGVNLNSVDLHNIVLMTDILRYPDQNVSQIDSLYRLVRIEIPALRKHIQDKVIPASSGRTDSTPVAAVRLQSRYLTAFSIGTAMALALNGFLRAMGSREYPLAAESDMFYTDLMAHAEYLKRRRPFGAGHVPVALISAWAATDVDLSRQEAMRCMFTEYGDDVRSFSWLRIAISLRRSYKRQCLKLSSLTTAVRCRSAVTDGGSSQMATNAAVAFEPEGACRIL